MITLVSRTGVLALIISAILVLDSTSSKAQASFCYCKTTTGHSARWAPFSKFSTDSSQEVLVRTAGVQYLVPEGYFRYTPTGCNIEQDILIRATYKDMLGPTNETKHLFSGELNSETLQILIRSSKQTTAIKGFLRILEGAYPGERGVSDGLSIYGLHRIRFQANRSYWRMEDVGFYKIKNNTMTDFFRCSRGEDGNLIWCRMYLLHNNAQVQIGFDPIHIPEWNIIKQKTIDLLKKFSDSAKRSEKEAC